MPYMVLRIECGYSVRRPTFLEQRELARPTYRRRDHSAILYRSPIMQRACRGLNRSDARVYTCNVIMHRVNV